MGTVYANGTVNVTVPDTEKIAIFSIASASLYKAVGYPNIPIEWKLVEVTDAGEQYVSDAVSGATVFQIQAGPALVQYSVGAAPVVSEPVTDIAAADATFTITGLAAAQGGYVRAVGGTSSTSGNAGGEAGIYGGQPGATGIGGAANVVAAAGGATSGKGGAATLTAGAGTAGNASGGSAIITAGAKHGSGLDGGVFLRGTTQFYKTGTPATATDTATLTAAQVSAGILVATPTAAANYTLPTGTLLKAALPSDIAAGDTFNLYVINSGGTGDDITFLVGADFTIIGNPVIGPIADVATEQEAQGVFAVRFVTGVTFVAYRIA